MDALAALVAIHAESRRVWVNVPGTGFFGVGRVVERVVPVEQFMLMGQDGKTVPIVQIPELMVSRVTRSTEDPEKAEYLVRVKWDKTVPEAQAVKERGFFGNQNTTP